MDLNKLVTETRNPRTMDLDKKSPLEIVTIMNEEDYHVVNAVKEVLPQIAQVVTWATQSVEQGGRIIYMGAGTSGRLGLMDAVECPPTFGVDASTVTGLLAGGEGAFIRAVEGAEDSFELGKEDLIKIQLRSQDIVIGLAASGRTPYVLGGLAYANELGCHTVAVACNKQSKIGQVAQCAIEVDCGPEVLTGSTRLKSGTAQKMILNMISTATMVGCGKVYQNLMVDVVQTNEKLVDRAERIIVEATGCTPQQAKKARMDAHGQVKVAIVMILLKCSYDQALQHLFFNKGHIRETII